jgi:zinc protease
LLPLTSLLLAASARGAAPAAEPRAYYTQKLPTGLELIAMESHKVPLDTIVLACKAGAMTETPEINGLTHLWEHMFFKGNGRLPNQEAFNKRIRQLGIEYNGDTAQEKVRYYFTLPSAFLDDGLQFMADAISTPLLEQKELERERRVVQDEYDRAAAQPSFDFSNLQRNYIYGKEEYLRDPLGLRPIIDVASREQLLRIKREVFVPSNCALLVAGDFKPAELDALASKHFTGWQDPPGWKPVKPPPFPPFPPTAAFLMTRLNVQNAHVSITFDGPKTRSQPKDSYAADVLVNLLEHRSGAFYRKFVDSGLTYEAGFGYYTQSQAGEDELYAVTDPKNAAKVQDMLLAEVKEWTKPDYFTAQQLEDVKRKLTINHKRELNQPTEYIKSMAFWWAVTGLDYYDSYLPNMYKVTLADVRAFVQKWLVGKPHVDGILMSPQDAKAAGLKDTAGPLVDKYLSMYKKTPAAPAIPGKG